MNKNELKKGQIYAHPNGNIVKAIDIGNNIINGVYIGGISVDKSFVKQGGRFTISEIRLAIPEEKHWLNTCIEQDKFISYEEAMKTFVKYYKIIVSKIKMNYNNNVIHKGSIVFGHYQGNNRIIKTIETGKHRTFSTIDLLYGKIGEQKVCFDMTALQPSTKEAYDAQFVVKEPEFVLPEKWCVLRDENNYITINKWCNENHLIGETAPYTCNNKKLVFSKQPYHSWNKYKRFCNSTDTSFIEITFEQFKKYVLKEEQPVIITQGHVDQLKLKEQGINSIVLENKIESKPFEILSIVNNITKEQLDLNKDGYFRSKYSNVHLNNVDSKYSIISVANKEGNIFEIGDTIISIKSKRKTVQTIKSFQYSVDKLKIQAVTTLHVKGINIERLEHFIEVEPVVKETLLEKAKRLYPVGTRFKNAYNFREAIVKTNNFIDEISKVSLENGMRTTSAGKWTIYNKNTDTWAEIIGYEPQIGDDFIITYYGNGEIANHTKGNKVHKIIDFKSSYENLNSVITFQREHYLAKDTVLLRNIKIIK